MTQDDATHGGQTEINKIEGNQSDYRHERGHDENQLKMAGHWALP
jgi:hypothetical protein